ncbi:MAG: efflux transporter outer membrane subunit [Gammaproteobacteria bacterium]|nr:MAG: efflux transporter outer membrane subunit [Gammaproteobacteria bacterium]
MKTISTSLPGAGIIVLLIGLGGCTTLGPDFERPEATIEPQWLETGDAETGLHATESDHSDWWTLFNDPVLDKLIQQAYQQNLPLQIAGLRIMEARAQLGIAVGSQYPQLQQAAGALTRVNLSENSANFNPVADDTFWTANAGFDAAWELDFWGRYRRGVEAASANLGTQVANYDNALVSLTAEVASVYVQIRTLQERLAVAHANVKTQQNGYRIADVRFRSGATSELDPAQALTLLRNTQAQIPALETSIRQATNALSVLLGMPPTDLTGILGEGGIPDAPANIAVGVPAELLRRRPDIRTAELQAASQSALIGVAESELYPRFSLVGSVGYTTSDTNQSDLGDIFNSDSFGYSFGPSFSWPILNYGRLKNNVRVQDARYEELIVNYQNTVLEAAREVEDGLSSFLGAKASAGFLGESVKSAQRSVDLSLIQYREGAVDYQRVLDSQASLLAQQDQHTSARGDITLNLVATYKALGGGWQIRTGNEVVPQVRQERMIERTDWGALIPAEPPAAGLPEPPPTGSAQPLFNSPDW